MKNLTITVDEDVVRWARITAAEQGESVSRLVGRMLKEKMQADQTYRASMKRDLARKPVALKPAGAPYPAREDLHGRSGLR